MNPRAIKIAENSSEPELWKRPLTYLLLFLFLAFFNNYIIGSALVVTDSSTTFIQGSNIRVALLDFSIKPSILINTFVSNINRYNAGVTPLEFSDTLINSTNSGYYELVDLVASSEY